MSNDDAPEDGGVRSFRTRRRTRRGKRRSLRVPVDEVPRRSAADDVSSDLPPAITHPIGDIEAEVTQPGSVPAPMLESVETEIVAELDSALETELEAELTSDLPTAPRASAASEPASEPAPAPGRPEPPGSAEPGAAAASEPAPPPVPEPPPSVPPPPEQPSAPPPSRAHASAPPPSSVHPPAPSAPAPSSVHPPAPSASAPSSVHPPAPSAPAPARPSSMPAARGEGSPSQPYVPPPPSVPRDIKVPEPAAAAPVAEPVTTDEGEGPRTTEQERPPQQPGRRRDSVVVRGTVRVSDVPEKRRVPEPPISDAPAALEEPDAPRAAAPTVEARDELEELDPADLEALESVRPAALPPNEQLPVAVEAASGEDVAELDFDEEPDADEIPGEPTLVAEPISEEPPAPAKPDAFPRDEASAEISVEDATAEEIEAFGLAPDELELEIDEDEPAADTDEAEELELSEAAQIAEPPPKPRSQPPPRPAGDAAAQAATQPEAAPAEAKEADKPAEPAPEPRPRRRRKPWWEDFFNDDYLRTVRPHPLRYVRRQCDFIEAQLGLERGATILDVGCGLGLHAVELASRGYLVVGLDLSLPMLSRAADEAQDRGLKINFLHGDMREMTFDGAFDAVLCWGTTLGYFDEETNRKVIERLYRALKPMGLLLIDAVNRDHVIRSQPNLVWFEGDGCVCMEETQFNYITSRLEVKRTVILDDGRQRENVYSIRLYSLNEIGQLLHHQGFRVAQVSGHEAHPGVFFGADSPRLIIMAERRLGKGSRETPKDDGRPPPPDKEEKPSSAPDEEIAELDLDPEPS